MIKMIKKPKIARNRPFRHVLDRLPYVPNSQSSHSVIYAFPLTRLRKGESTSEPIHSQTRCCSPLMLITVSRTLLLRLMALQTYGTITNGSVASPTRPTIMLPNVPEAKDGCGCAHPT